MRAAIDARPALDPRPTGIGHYTDRIARYLPIVDRDGEYVAWYLHARGALRPRRFFSDVPGLEEHASRFPARVFGPLSIRVGWPQVRTDFDALLATNFLPPEVAPGLGHRVVMVVHDLAFERLPQTAPHHNARWRRAFYAWLGRAGAVIVPSAATRKDLLGLYDVDPALVHVIAMGAEPFDRPDARSAGDARDRLGVVPGPYVLFVGGIELRKNLEVLVEAFAEVADEVTGGLVLAGAAVPWDPGAALRLDAALERLPASVRVRIVRTGYVTPGEKRALMEGATVLAYPSLWEGFGLPVLEGFAAGVPVLTSDSSSLPEVAGEAAVLVTPDVDGIAGGLRRLLGDEGLRSSLVEAGRHRVAGYTWERCARATADVLHRVAGGPG